MKTRRKPRQRTLLIDMTVPLHPVSYERGKELFRKISLDITRGFTTIPTRP